MENKIVLPESAQAKYDNLRFPKIWHAVLGSALMYVPVYAVVFLITLTLGVNYTSYFKTEFGADMFSAVLSQFFAVLIIPVFILLVSKRDISATVRLKKNLNVIQILLLVVFSISAFLLLQTINSFFIMWLSSFLGEPSDISNITDASNIPQLLFEIVIVGGLPAICEELFFRGFVMRAFERKSRVFAVLMSSFIFAVMHGNLQQLSYAFLCGIILGTVVMITDSLLAGCMIHFTFNTLSVIISYPPISEIYTHYATNYVYIFSAVVMLVLPIIAVSSLVLFIMHSLKRNRNKYNCSVPTDLKYAHLMPLEKPWEKAIKSVSWIIFIGVNVLFMIANWYMV
ncbi:MAG: CPBP family intramembrane metalloprotease [Clostridiales bacterium]|nr:CPBP family intramembrane metalloprotease [Clostridiales bacterium]